MWAHRRLYHTRDSHLSLVLHCFLPDSLWILNAELTRQFVPDIGGLGLGGNDDLVGEVADVGRGVTHLVLVHQLV